MDPKNRHHFLHAKCSVLHITFKTEVKYDLVIYRFTQPYVFPEIVLSVHRRCTNTLHCTFVLYREALSETDLPFKGLMAQFSCSTNDPVCSSLSTLFYLLWKIKIEDLFGTCQSLWSITVWMKCTIIICLLLCTNVVKCMCVYCLYGVFK